MTTAAALTFFAALLAWPVPRWLAGARWTHGCPRAAIVLWQAIGLAGGVSALLAAVAFTVSPLGSSTPGAIRHHLRNLADGQPLSGLDWLNLIGLVIAAALAGRLFCVLASSTFATLRQRHRHRHLVDLAGDEHAESSCHTGREPRSRRRDGIQYWTPLSAVRHLAAASASASAVRGAEACELCGHVGLRILDHPVAVAYCVPGVRSGARVVVSRGLLTTLGPRELQAVLAHEDAHVSGRHDLVIQPFVAWQQTFPFLRPAWEATAAVSLLVEMLADDVAARRTSGNVLARALAQLGVTRALVPAGTLGAAGHAAGQSAGAAVSSAAAAAWALHVGGKRAGELGAGGMRADAPAAGDGSGLDAPPSRSPVIARIVRLLEPPAVPWWRPAAAYVAAAAILATPFLLLTL